MEHCQLDLFIGLVREHPLRTPLRPRTSHTPSDVAFHTNLVCSCCHRQGQTRPHAAGVVDMKVFKWLISSVTLLVINKLRSEWKVIDTVIATQDSLGSCDCEMLHGYSLPCKHFLLRVAQSSSPIPRSLLSSSGGGSTALLLNAAP